MSIFYDHNTFTGCVGVIEFPHHHHCHRGVVIVEKPAAYVEVR